MCEEGWWSSVSAQNNPANSPLHSVQSKTVSPCSLPTNPLLPPDKSSAATNEKQIWAFYNFLIFLPMDHRIKFCLLQRKPSASALVSIFIKQQVLKLKICPCNFAALNPHGLSWGLMLTVCGFCGPCLCNPQLPGVSTTPTASCSQLHASPSQGHSPWLPGPSFACWVGISTPP